MSLSKDELAPSAGEWTEPEFAERVSQWPMNLRNERDGGFLGQPSAHVNVRQIPFSMGKILGGDQAST
jgi:choline dehydrogenase